MQIVVPADFSALIALLVNPVTMGILLTWFIGHIPLIKNDSVTNWVKFVFAVVVCLIWSFLVTVGTHGLPATPDQWYALVYTGLAVAFANQAFYQVVNNIPALADFLLALFGKTPAPTLISANVRPAIPPRPPTIQVKPEDIIPNVSTGATS